METNEQRQGLFWDMLEGRVPPPPSAATLGWELIGLDPEQGTIEVAFEAGEQFKNPGGAVQGGFLAAMLDDAMGPALAATLPPDRLAPTLDLHVQYLRPARPGRFTGRGRVVQRGKEVCFLAGELLGADGKTVAVATATARIQAMP
ncbi:phenylacetic acid degradation protein [Streptomyces abyssalis]|uniref:Phenylacetic acid degradation protein n=1 Tax=Streptomyces abyssalis TaxID=933944 RepID=A0A1E7JKK1_9ACTN|nr:PaaI family thioesterase [Streptomyces abyssalis]OEU88152.1 phenylacetic acid degradation protein [Streptomyces abyssalis]OEU91023.1 phenylacetic acid degradation protein [Streptomyces abyssalis]OEV30569.1 phenylacetic acid degradation protein [Streptomyces nanshensis]